MEEKQKSTAQDMKRWKNQMDEFDLNIFQIEHIENQIKADIPKKEMQESIETFEKALKEGKDETGKEFSPIGKLKVQMAVDKMKKELAADMPTRKARFGLRQLGTQKENFENNKKAILKMMRNHEEQHGKE